MIGSQGKNYEEVRSGGEVREGGAGYVQGQLDSGRCAVETTDGFGVEVGLHQGSALCPFLFAIIMDRLTDGIRQEAAPWIITFPDDIVICSEHKQQMEASLKRWRHALEKRRISQQKQNRVYVYG